MVGDRSSLSLAGDAWSAAAPGGVAGERERARQRERHESERESEVERRGSEREIAWVRERVRDVGVLLGLYPN